MIHKVLQFLRHNSRLHFVLNEMNISFDYFKYFAEGVSRKTEGMTQNDPLLHKSLIICIYISRKAIHSKKTYLQNKPSKPSCRAFRSLRQNNFEMMIYFAIDSINISAPILRTAEHTFGIRWITS